MVNHENRWDKRLLQPISWRGNSIRTWDGCLPTVVMSTCEMWTPLATGNTVKTPEYRSHNSWRLPDFVVTCWANWLVVKACTLCEWLKISGSNADTVALSRLWILDDAMCFDKAAIYASAICMGYGICGMRTICQESSWCHHRGISPVEARHNEVLLRGHGTGFAMWHLKPLKYYWIENVMFHDLHFQWMFHISILGSVVVRSCRSLWQNADCQSSWKSAKHQQSRIVVAVTGIVRRCKFVTGLVEILHINLPVSSIWY